MGRTQPEEAGRRRRGGYGRHRGVWLGDDWRRRLAGEDDLSAEKRRRSAHLHGFAAERAERAGLLTGPRPGDAALQALDCGLIGLQPPPIST